MSTTTYTPPQCEPASLMAGDSWQWDRSVDLFKPSGGWTLTYYFNGPAAFSVATATSSSGDYFEVRQTAATNAARTAGNYRLVGYVTDGTDRHLVYDGRVEVHPNLATASATVSHARRMLTAIEAALEEMFESGTTYAEVEVNGRRVKYDHGGLMKQRGIYAAIVAQEENRGRRTRPIAAHFVRG